MVLEALWIYNQLNSFLSCIRIDMYFCVSKPFHLECRTWSPVIFNLMAMGSKRRSHIRKACEDFRQCEEVLYSLKQLVTIFSPGPIPLPKSLETRGSSVKKKL